MTEHDHRTPTLSPAGQARRAAMRDVLLREVDRRRARRRLGRAGAAAAAGSALVAGVVALNAALPRPSPPGAEPPPRLAQAPGDAGATPGAGSPPRELARVRFQVVSTPPGPDGRIVAGSAPRARPIDDDELLLLLDAAGHPSGLIRTGGAAMLTAAIPPLPARGDGG